MRPTPLRAEQRDRELGDLGRRPADAHALALQRLGLGRGAVRAGHDRAGVAHRLAGRRGEAGDVGDDRLGHVVGDELGRPFLGVAADLAAHHDQLGLGVVLEHADHVDEVGPGHRVAADPDDRRVAEPALGEHVADLVGQRARARDDADVALLEERGRDDPDVGLARRQDARAVGADQPRAAVLLERVVDAQLVVSGDALGDADDQLDARRPRPRGSSRRRTAAARTPSRCWRRPVDRLVEGVEDRESPRRPGRPCRGSRRRRPWCRSRGCAASGTCPRGR